ncbi:HD domain-containing protein [Nocardiopsis sp. NPDC058631]|uniref:HD domain-containing protein n=1 Tax=Nocardiopsis sp. NPDC058631 TaxID=3346566 RepID=UPI003649AE7B
MHEAGTLKNQRRTGWWMAGVRDSESVAEHSWRTSLIASVLASMEGADPARAAFAEYEARETAEAACAKDADKLECLSQGMEYRARGHGSAQRWIDNSRARIKTRGGRALADAALTGEPVDWLRAAMGEDRRSGS